jgi:1,4-alpha-glucan branching enzyme
MINQVNPGAITIAEEMSGMPGLASSLADGGYGFHFRMAMGVPDYWIKIIKERLDEEWNIPELYYELTSKRKDEKTISYAESHDQALVGDKTLIFRLIDREMYFSMDKSTKNLVVDRGIALHKMIRLITAATGGGGYLNFMGNEFGHPEWIDFPRAGNNWSFQYARRQWNLVDDDNLKYHLLGDFDQDMVHLLRDNGLLEVPYCRLLADNGPDKILAFERGDFVFIFSFNPSLSFTDYGIQSSPGKYRIVLNTDNVRYGGQGLVDESMTYFAQVGTKLNDPHMLRLYLPTRVGMVLKRLPTPRVY